MKNWDSETVILTAAIVGFTILGVIALLTGNWSWK